MGRDQNHFYVLPTNKNACCVDVIGESTQIVHCVLSIFYTAVE